MCSHRESPPGTAATTPDVTPLADLEREICTLAAELAAATCRWLELLAEWDERCGWADWGTRSCAHWLSWRCSLGLGTAREHVRVARCLTTLPLTRASFGAGELSYCKVRALTRVVHAGNEHEWLDIARNATGAQLEKLVRHCRGVAAATSSAADETYRRRQLDWDWEPDGSLSLRVRLPAEDGALLMQALEASDTWPHDWKSATDPEAVCAQEPIRATLPERRADALVTLARAALAHPPAAGSHADPCQLVVHVDAAAFAGDESVGHGEVVERAETERGQVLAPETIRRLGCDAAVVAIVERDGRALAVGRRTRVVPTGMRRALRARDGGCRFPGCTHTRFLHAHHIKHWARGGPTNLENLVQLCSHHHRLVHEGGFTVECLAPSRLRFRTPAGQRIVAAGRLRAPAGSCLPCWNRTRGVRVDDWTAFARSAGDRLDYGIAVDCLSPGLLAPRTGEPRAPDSS